MSKAKPRDYPYAHKDGRVVKLDAGQKDGWKIEVDVGHEDGKRDCLEEEHQGYFEPSIEGMSRIRSRYASSPSVD
ncbi:hypothetical protein E5676_scaffold110G00100 [Cucumis melo var. makuwa]|uniref:Uncharacterized protein n=1 Tax=Cucumis melo var. makuwa TaxID=1194695 RepID=A0A5D3B8X7_CUCMM|nr:hypothetical protein E6C27_scaffold977G00610 [Cucumis melo var. makuwa]TYJ95753.1 hypothetical protein E5676_scaffold110G00100 [Cucumis melo var. makuwa]